MNSLPISTIIPSVKQLLSMGTKLVLSAPPGAGKTTGIPTALLGEPWLKGRKIIMLEPRRLAARTAAERIAYLLKEEVGQTVGYRIRLESRVGPATRIEIVTEGILTRYLQRDPMLEGVGLVIVVLVYETSRVAAIKLWDAHASSIVYMRLIEAVMGSRWCSKSKFRLNVARSPKP